MPYTTKWEDKGIVWTYSGVVTRDDVIHSNYEFYNDERSDNTKYQIVDGSNVISFNIEKETTDEIAAMDYAFSNHIKDLKVALISSDDKVISVYNTYMQTTHLLHTDWLIQVFENIDDAREWTSL